MIKLKGMTWSHPRGYDPMIACSKLWQEKTGVSVEWEQRSLQDFESFPVEELARSYDLIVIDHPHVGQITEEGCLTPLDVPGRDGERQELRNQSVGQSYDSYHRSDHQWAFPIDAAAQVLAWRPDLLDHAPASWDEVLDLARRGSIMLPLRPPHSLMCFYTLAGNLGQACNTEGDILIDPAAGAQVWQLLQEVAALVSPACLEMDPIAVFEEMAKQDSTICCAPLAYGYVSYAIPGIRPNLIRFADMPAVGGEGSVGSALGGTGIAVSAYCAEKEAAIDFAYWIASGEIQTGPYAAAGGQPGHAAAWEDESVNAAVSGFYRDTRATLEGAWVRPRHNGYMAMQELASDRINEGLKMGDSAENVIKDLNRLFRESFKKPDPVD